MSDTDYADRLEARLKTERGLREAAEAERDAMKALYDAAREMDEHDMARLEAAEEERQQIKASLIEYIEAFKQEAADNIALKNKLEAAEAELIKARQYDREVRRALAPDPDIHLSDTIEAVYALWQRHDNMRAYASRLLAALVAQRQALHWLRNHLEWDTTPWQTADAALATDTAALLAEGETLGVTP